MRKHVLRQREERDARRDATRERTESEAARKKQTGMRLTCYVSDYLIITIRCVHACIMYLFCARMYYFHIFSVVCICVCVICFSPSLSVFVLFDE